MHWSVVKSCCNFKHAIKIVKIFHCLLFITLTLSIWSKQNLTIMMSMHLDITATLSSKFSVKTIDFASQKEIYNIQWVAITCRGDDKLCHTLSEWWIILRTFGDVFSLASLVHTSPTSSFGLIALHGWTVICSAHKVEKVVTKNSWLPLKLTV